MLHLYNGENNMDALSGGEDIMRCCDKFHILEPENVSADMINIISKSTED